jgi:hypothetical protein
LPTFGFDIPHGIQNANIQKNLQSATIRHQKTFPLPTEGNVQTLFTPFSVKNKSTAPTLGAVSTRI